MFIACTFKLIKLRSNTWYTNHVGMKGPSKGIGPWAMTKDAKEPEDNHVLIRTRRLRGQGRWPITTNRWCCPKSQTSSDNKMEVWSSTTQQILGKGQPCLEGYALERWVNKELRNIWEEGCYHHIKCSTYNQLAAFM